MSREAMKQAVATFEKIVDGCNGIDESQDVHSEAKKVARLVMKDCLPALKALRQALAHEALDEMVAENQRLGLYDDGPAVKTYAGGKPNYCTKEEST